MNRFVRIAIILVFGLGALAAAGAQQLSTSTLKVSRTVPLPGKSASGRGGRSASFEFSLLAVKGPTAVRRIAYRELYGGLTPEAFIDKTIREFTADAADYGGDGGEWYDDVTTELEYRTSGFVSLGSTTERFSGGAHPNRYSTYVTIDLETEKKVPLADLIASDRCAGFLAAAERKIRTDYEVPENGSLSGDGKFLVDRLEALPANYIPGVKGLALFWNDYDIAPYSTGPVTVEFTPEELRPFLSARGLRLWGLAR